MMEKSPSEIFSESYAEAEAKFERVRVIALEEFKNSCDIAFEILKKSECEACQ